MDIQLLAELNRIFDEQDADGLGSAFLCTELRDVEDGPWADWGTRRREPGFRPRDLAEQLRPYGIRSRVIRLRPGDDRGSTKHGYKREQLVDAWERYLPEPNPPSLPSLAVSEAMEGDAGEASPSDSSDGTGEAQIAREGAEVTDVTADEPRRDAQKPWEVEL